MGTRTGLGRCGKCRSPPGFDRRTVQPVATRYIDGATGPTIRLNNPYQFLGIEEPNFRTAALYPQIT